MITLAGVIGAGKSSLAEVLARRLQTIEPEIQPFYEPVDDNPILPLFYKGNQLVEEGKAETNPYAFLLQIYFLNQRFHMIKAAMQNDHNVLDRSIYEDALFMKMNVDEGHATPQEWEIYQDLLNNMMEELPYAAKKKRPDLMIMIDVSYDTMLKRIHRRGRPYEQVETDPSLKSYYQELITRYHVWKDEYNESELLVIDGDTYDFMASTDDRITVINQIEEKLLEIGSLNQDEFDQLKQQPIEEI
ncbi:MAG: deoxynucleoside kinase [Aerococcus sp.]|nr:deoxynucleoside kinase [Aerococcus sp.]